MSDRASRRTPVVDAVIVGSGPNGLAAAVTALRAAGFTLAALTPGGDLGALAGLAGHQRVALLLGAEGPGLSDEALAAADVRVRIPKAGDVDSLNVATAAAVAFHATAGPVGAAS